jgi:hypothetical protein
MFKTPGKIAKLIVDSLSSKGKNSSVRNSEQSVANEPRGFVE